LDISVDDCKIIGQGEFGIVLRGVLTRKRVKIPIVAKKAKNPNEPGVFDMIFDEVTTIIRAGEHKNIVTFFGITSDAKLKGSYRVKSSTSSCDCE